MAIPGGKSTKLIPEFLGRLHEPGLAVELVYNLQDAAHRAAS